MIIVAAFMKISVTCPVVAVLLLCALAWPAGAQRGSDDRDEDRSEHILLELANRERAARGLAPLKWSNNLAEAAHAHAILMASQNTLSHQFSGEAALAERASGVGVRFSSLAENVAEGPSAEAIHRQWMNSPPHRANLLDPGLDSVGIAITERGGTLFAVEDFSLSVAELSLRDQEKLVEAQLHRQGLHLLDYSEDARRSCGLDNGYAGNHRPSFVVHYATSDLQALPAMLTGRIHSGKYHFAVVGACPSNGKYGFSSYRVAVLLFE
jgi:hypothetical protein